MRGPDGDECGATNDRGCDTVQNPPETSQGSGDPRGPVRYNNIKEHIKDLWEDSWRPKIRSSASSITSCIIFLAKAAGAFLILQLISWALKKILKHPQYFSEWFLDVCQFIDDHGWVIYLVTYIILFILISSFLRALEHYRLGTIARRTGVFFVSKNFRIRHRRKSTIFLRKNSEGNKLLYIMGASGWKTFGDQNEAPLYRAVKSCTEVRIIIAHPYSAKVEERANHLNFPVADYRKEIWDSVNYLSVLKRQGHRIMLKMYIDYPSWKYIVLDQFCWIQKYDPSRHIEKSPCFAFQEVVDEDGLPNPSIHSHITQQFQVLWDYSDRLWEYNFDSKKLTDFNVDGDKLVDDSPQEVLNGAIYPDRATPPSMST